MLCARCVRQTCQFYARHAREFTPHASFQSFLHLPQGAAQAAIRTSMETMAVVVAAAAVDLVQAAITKRSIEQNSQTH
ncbi:MAG: hypothetical protein M1281_11985 [Chloroflexi bacterium]|nr:hypothetical protein [Chloroflexota bacterium]